MTRATALALLLSLTLSRGGGAGTDDPAFFAEKVQPVLKTYCLECHSHASGKIKGGLTLDSRSGWEGGGVSGPAVVPGAPERSLLIRAVSYNDPDLKMPPKAQLPAEQIAVLNDWVKRGAPGPRDSGRPAVVVGDDWWSLRALVRPHVPVTHSPARNPIDRFIQAGLVGKGLTPSPEADRRTLIRRLTFDLHGLPPTPEEADSFVRDESPGAYETLVERLLASPRYGERMARLWLDVAHYGESDGFGMDRPRMQAWPYRDYLIRSFNQDTPYSRFVQEQLAADALFPRSPALTPALGFLAAGPFNQSALAEQVDGTLCKKIALNLDRDDMVSSVSSTLLSVTLHCARCHDHKFDPVTMRDYYRMQAVFSGVVRGNREYDEDDATARERARWRTVRRRLGAGEPPEALAPDDQSELLAASGGVEDALAGAEAAWQTPRVSAISDSGPTKVVALPDGSVRFEGTAAEVDTYVLVARTPLESVTALRLEVLADDTLPRRGPGRSPTNGNFHLSEIRVIAAPLAAPEQAERVTIRAGTADFDQAGWEVTKAFDGRPETAWGVDPQESRSHQAVFRFEKALAHSSGSLLTIRLEQRHGRGHVIGRLRISVRARDPASDRLVSPDVIALLRTPAPRRSGEDAKRILGALAPLLAEERIAALPPVQKVLAVGGDLPAFRNYKAPKQPYPIHVLARGDVTRPLEEVRPGAIEAVTALPALFELEHPEDEAARRAALARWVTDGRNPLTWRSIVNRVWLWHFDRGLVETPNDFGRMGGTPSHPELLDWLARAFRDSGGSLKGLHRLIVTSGTYRQSSPANDRASAIDGDNRLLWRMNRRRLDAEQIRDAVLSASGQLDPLMGGPSAMQFRYSDPNPEVVPMIDYDGFDPDSPAGHRRGIYRFLFRNVNDPLLDAFDAANPSLSTPRRDATVTALQALSLFNNRFVLRQCEHLADRLRNEANDLPGQVDRAFRLLYTRPPHADEAALVAEYARVHGLAHACRVLLNANEFLFLP